MAQPGSPPWQILWFTLLLSYIGLLHSNTGALSTSPWGFGTIKDAWWQLRGQARISSPWDSWQCHKIWFGLWGKTHVHSNPPLSWINILLEAQGSLRDCFSKQNKSDQTPAVGIGSQEELEPLYSMRKVWTEQILHHVAGWGAHSICKRFLRN